MYRQPGYRTLSLLVLILSSVALHAEIPTKPWGIPSLEGTWDFKSLTPLNRPADMADKEFLAPEEAAKIEVDVKQGRNAAAATEGGVREGLDGQSDVDVGYNSGFLELGSRLDPSLRTSLIIEPLDGRMPAMTAAGRERNKPYWHMQSLSPDGPEMRNLTDRCLIGFNNNPMRSGAYNNIMQIVQSQSHIAIQIEMVNDHRIIPTDGSGSVPQDAQFWKGFSSGEWQGDTFVVTTTNFKPYAAPLGTGDNVVMTERFTRLDADTLQYEWTIDDPESYPVPFTARQQMRLTTDDVYEFACHEGNYSMPLTLKAARKMDKDGESDDTWMPSWFKGLLAN
jgi:hypothetical protein